MMITETLKKVLLIISKSPGKIDKSKLLQELKGIEGFEKYHEWLDSIISSHDYMSKHSGGPFA